MAFIGKYQPAQTADGPDYRNTFPAIEKDMALVKSEAEEQWPFNVIHNPANNVVVPISSSIYLVAADNGITMFLPDARNNKGLSVEAKQTSNSGTYTNTFKSQGGNIENTLPTVGYSFVSVSRFAAVVFRSDGVNWWIVGGV